MNELRMDDVVQRNADLVSTDMDGETVMMSIENGAYYGLNAVGSEVWETIEKPASVTSICENVASKFDVTLHNCTADVLALLSDLIDNDLVKVMG